MSRQAAQRLVALAVDEKLIRFRLDHPLAESMALSEGLSRRHGLAYCAVEPTDPLAENPRASIAAGAAEYLSSFLAQKAPLVLAFSTGRTLRAMVEEVAPMSCPQHKLVSLVGAISREGRASAMEVVMRWPSARVRSASRCPRPLSPAASRSGSSSRPSTPMPSSATLPPRPGRLPRHQPGRLASPCHQDLFVTDAELADLIDRGAVGEIAAGPSTARPFLDSGTNDGVAGLPLARLGKGHIIGVTADRENPGHRRSAPGPAHLRPDRRRGGPPPPPSPSPSPPRRPQRCLGVGQ